MTGWRLGWMVVPPWAIDAVRTLAQNMYISPPGAGAARCRRRLHARGVGDRGGAPAGVPGAARRARGRAARPSASACDARPEGAFYVYADISAFDTDSAAFARRLLHDAGVAVTPGQDFGTNGADRHVRFSYTTVARQHPRRPRSPQTDIS